MTCIALFLFLFFVFASGTGVFSGMAYIYNFWIVLFVFHILLSRFGYASCSGIEFVYIFDSKEGLV
jgi:hypothetical protein